MPKGRMGPPLRSFAADAHDCIMVRVLGPAGYKVVARVIAPASGLPSDRHPNRTNRAVVLEAVKVWPGNGGACRKVGATANLSPRIPASVSELQTLQVPKLPYPCGWVGYLESAARKHPKYFLPLIGRMVPLDINESDESEGPISINIVSVPSGHFFDADGKLTARGAATENEPVQVEAPIERIEEPIEQTDKPVEAVEEPLGASGLRLVRSPPRK